MTEHASLADPAGSADTGAIGELDTGMERSPGDRETRYSDEMASKGVQVVLATNLAA